LLLLFYYYYYYYYYYCLFNCLEPRAKQSSHEVMLVFGSESKGLFDLIGKSEMDGHPILHLPVVWRLSDSNGLIHVGEASQRGHWITEFSHLCRDGSVGGVEAIGRIRGSRRERGKNYVDRVTGGRMERCYAN
jgi:hypothetical protein